MSNHQLTATKIVNYCRNQGWTCETHMPNAQAIWRLNPDTIVSIPLDHKDINYVQKLLNVVNWLGEVEQRESMEIYHEIMLGDSTPKYDEGTEIKLWLESFRYSLTRRSAAVSEFCEKYLQYYDVIPQRARSIINQELRQDVTNDRLVGNECDQVEWRSLLDSVATMERTSTTR